MTTQAINIQQCEEYEQKGVVPEGRCAAYRAAAKRVFRGWYVVPTEKVAAIKAGRRPQGSDAGPALRPPATDADADPANEKPGSRGCCDPPT